MSTLWEKSLHAVLSVITAEFRDRLLFIESAIRSINFHLFIFFIVRIYVTKFESMNAAFSSVYQS